MNNAQLAEHHRSIAALYSRLDALDKREHLLEVLRQEQAAIDASRKDLLVELESMASLDTSSDAIPSGLPIPPFQPPV